jgi:hypothetical protein
MTRGARLAEPCRQAFLTIAFALTPLRFTFSLNTALSLIVSRYATPDGCGLAKQNAKGAKNREERKWVRAEASGFACFRHDSARGTVRGKTIQQRDS